MRIKLKKKQCTIKLDWMMNLKTIKTFTKWPRKEILKKGSYWKKYIW
jgi:hypothetical protein